MLLFECGSQCSITDAPAGIVKHMAGSKRQSNSRRQAGLLSANL
jgi:hypothetical protein